ncbi:polymeric immunoglobulin receptor-like [Oreochromis aureus]|uniref:polymeric immunoglobulin receptor-like n=1 Tax=Oreochromis aureus TaxID=47969 RepID=UPI00195424D4|nr:polymeric immunoglobulin receptor-like [Oreochromis aureus]
MKILHFLFFCFLSGPAGLVKPKHNIWSAAEGANGTLNCNLSLSGSTKFFCKEKCERAEDILIKTDESTAQSGRYSMKYKDGSPRRGIVFLSFSQMIKSDAGMYRCGLGKSSAPDSYFDFEVRVSNDLDRNVGFYRTQTEGENITLGCSNTVTGHRKFFCKNQCKNEGEILIDTTNNKSVSGRYSIEHRPGSVYGLYATITQSSKSDTGKYICGYGNPLSPDSYANEYFLVIDDSNPPTSTPQTTTQMASNPPASTLQTATTQSESVTAGVSTHCPDSSWLLVVRASLDGVLLMAVFLMLFYISKTRRNFGLKSRENDTNMEFSVTHENWEPTFKHKESKSSRTKPTLHY